MKSWRVKYLMDGGVARRYKYCQLPASFDFELRSKRDNMFCFCFDCETK